MSYTHPILVPGADGHDDPEALRAVIESSYRPKPTEIHRIIENIVEHSARVRRVLTELNDVTASLEKLEDQLDALADHVEEVLS